MQQSPSSEANVPSAIQDIPRILCSAKFITVFVKEYHWLLAWYRWTQSTRPHLLCLKLFLILSSNLRLRSGRTTKTLYAYFCPSCDPNTRPRGFRLPAAVQLRPSFFCDVIKRRLVFRDASEEAICPHFQEQSGPHPSLPVPGPKWHRILLRLPETIAVKDCWTRQVTALGFSDTAQQPRFYSSLSNMCVRVYCYSPTLA